MRETNQRRALARLVRGAALAAGVLVLAGCATGYSFVQPEVAGSGGYYTGDGPYSGQGYYDYYGTGPYYPGTSGYGYYNGSYPYGNMYGYYGRNYGYGPGWTFNLGISNVWNFPGYWGPWYSTGFPVWGCYTWRCGNRHHRRHDHGHDHGDHARDHDYGDRITSRPWRKPGQHGTPPVQILSGSATPRSGEDLTNHRRVDAAVFRHERYVRAPQLQTGGRAVGSPARPVYNGARVPNEPAFANHRAVPISAPMTAPRRINPPPQWVSRPAAPRAAAPMAIPPPARRHGNAPDTKVQ